MRIWIGMIFLGSGVLIVILSKPEKVVIDDVNLGGEKESVVMPHVSRCAVPWWERDEPIYEPWLFDNQVEWIRHWKLVENDYVRTIHGDVAKISKKVEDFEMSKEDLDKFVSSKPMKRIVGALHGWHQLNAKQLCAFTGIHSRNLTRYTNPLFKAGILERGRYVMPNRNENRNQLWKLHYGKNYKRFVKALDLQDYWNITFGVSSKGSLPHERHNVTAAEIALRWHETANVDLYQGVSPERLNDPKIMVSGFDSRFKQKSDLCVVRDDGLRIMLEITNSSNYMHLRSKMQNWVRTLAERPYSQMGMHVIFVNTSPYNFDELSRTLRKIHALELTPEKTKLDADTNKRAAARISVASYRNWFPSRWNVSNDFRKLTSIRRIGDSADSEDWTEVDLFGKNAIKFSPAEGVLWDAPSVNLPNLLSTPSWAGGKRSVTP